MSTASPRKEPSMDEILASIRRIIESGEERDETSGDALLSISPGAPASDDDALRSDMRSASTLASPVPPFDIHYLPTALGEEPAAALQTPDAARSDDEAATVEIESSEHTPNGQVAFHDQPAETVAVSPAPPADVSDDAWWDAAVADANDVESEVEPASAELEVAQVEPPLPDNENVVAHDGVEALRSNWNEVAGDASPAPAEMVDPSPASHEAPFVPALRSTEAAASEASPRVAVASVPETRAEMPESVIAGASALLSMQAGDQVAAAFDDLTRAIRDGHMRSMEGMAREIMRPMLQEWLDDNLPRIVERLVREEIERIARGPRR